MSDDADTIAQCLSGSPERYRELVDRHGPEVRAFVGASAAPGQSDDVIVEAFTRAWLKLASLRNPRSFGPWVKGIALRVLKEQARRTPIAGDLPPAQPSSTVSSADPDLHAAIERLPEPYRTVIRLRYFAGISCAQIAARGGAPVGTVTKQLTRAYALLREALDPQAPRPRHAHSEMIHELPERT